MGPVVRCFWNGVPAKEVWIRLLGLALHLWKELFSLYGTGVEVLLWWMKISLRIEIVNGLDL